LGAFDHAAVSTDKPAICAKARHGRKSLLSVVPPMAKVPITSITSITRRQKSSKTVAYRAGERDRPQITTDHIDHV
jgi:hypothetical protein